MPASPLRFEHNVLSVASSTAPMGTGVLYPNSGPFVRESSLSVLRLLSLNARDCDARVQSERFLRHVYPCGVFARQSARRVVSVMTFGWRQALEATTLTSLVGCVAGAAPPPVTPVAPCPVGWLAPTQGVPDGVLAPPLTQALRTCTSPVPLSDDAFERRCDSLITDTARTFCRAVCLHEHHMFALAVESCVETLEVNPAAPPACFHAEPSWKSLCQARCAEEWARKPRPVVTKHASE
jgi:hypothetical protein